ncbi:kinase-like domain-containing protein [Thelephora terrestris]|uniref:Kinase-like domain-containing protein n=1 Tax=Thelephora terrestris TaxID=56493 RepID=A0A9P6HPR7_9AGAM|nr:kinase-like domain-containing protein [Thelephora terrestris]
MPSPKAQRPVFKPSDDALQELDRLKRFSPNFPDQLASLLSRENFQDWDVCKSLREEDAVWLIEYLDNALDTLDPVDPAYRKCLDVLQKICFIFKRLPRSYILDVSSFVPIAGPTPIGPYEIIYKGSINGLKAYAKKLSPSLSSKWSYVKRNGFYNISKWNYLTHPNIVPFLGIANEPIHLVWAWAPGVELKEYINNHPDTNRLDLLIDIANGLNYLHSRNVTHGDLGGPNIIVDDSGRLCITEYGLPSLFFQFNSDKFRQCKRWADPRIEWGDTLLETTLVKIRATPQVDVFSFAMVMVEVFTGQVPFYPEPDSAVLSALKRGERPERPTHMDLTTKLWALVERCWDNKSAYRPEISEVLGILHDCRNDDRGLVPALPPASSDWLSQITNEILDLTDQVASVALYGPIGVGKSFVARSVLDSDRTKAKFGDNRYFMCCDGLEDSMEGFIQRLSDTIHTDVAQLKSHLQSSLPLILLLDGVDYALDPLSPEAEEIGAMIEEFGSYEHFCLVTTSRTYPDIHGFHRVEVPTPTEGGGQDIFYGLCSLARSPTVDVLITTLDSHPFSIELFARIIRENGWDEQELLKMWDDPKGMLRTTYYETLKNTIEPVFRSPRIKELGTKARDAQGSAIFSPWVMDHTS